MRMPILSHKAFYAWLLALALAGCAIHYGTAPDDGAMCVTDSECAELCPTGTRELPADHPDYCDGGPQS